MNADDALAEGIARWLPTTRFLASKGLPPAPVTIVERARVADGVELVLADTGAATDAGLGRPTRYVLPVDEAGGDAAARPAFVGWLAATALGGGATAGRCGSFVGHPLDPGGWSAEAPPEASPLAQDASNTSLEVRQADRRFVVKLLRRYRPGVQPEVELGWFFARESPWSGTPRLRGWIEHRPAGGEAAAIATVHDHVPGCRSAWDHLLEAVRDGALAASSADAGRLRLVALIEGLGRTTAEMHRALAARPDLPPFAPEPAAAGVAEARAAAILATARRVLSRAAAPALVLPAGVGQRLVALATRAPSLLAGLATAAAAHEQTVLIRVHGDYHLGQVLAGRRGDDWELQVIDFEGEPGRSLEDRRAKFPAARDVAGMSRSFDYLLRCAERAGGPRYDPGHLRQLEGWFLAAYESVAAGGRWWPAGSAALVDLYRLDKAFYELAYELDHRPDWVTVPLAALEARVADADAGS